MAKAKPRKTEEEKKREVEQLMEVLQNGVLEFEYSPESIKALLLMQSLMPTYSFRNIMLIASQLSTSSYVASFKRWKELNRSVRKGEKALRIFAPRFVKEKNEETGIEELKLIGFIPVPVFDVSQTEGEELPIEKHRLKLDGESEEAVKILQWVEQLASEDDCRFMIGNALGANGYYAPASHSIVVDTKLSANHKAKTAVHELVHSRVHRNDSDSASRNEQECVAEGAAFIICSYFGLDTSDYSFGYVKGWSADDGVSLMKYGELIQKTANTLISDFERLVREDEVANESTDEQSNVETIRQTA